MQAPALDSRRLHQSNGKGCPEGVALFVWPRASGVFGLWMPSGRSSSAVCRGEIDGTVTLKANYA
jgi:hypothetical protein